MIEKIERIATNILDSNPDTVIRYLILKEVLKIPIGSNKLQNSHKELQQSKQVQLLKNEQRENGGWGEFHSRSTKNKQIIASTEVGVERALALGLEKDDPILKKNTNYIIDIMNGKIVFPDYHEKNDRWETGMRLFLASTLSLIHPNHSMLESDRKLWHEIAKNTFKNGKYSEEDEIIAHSTLTGATVKDSYLVLSNRYQLNILGSQNGLLSDELENAILNWIFHKPYGIGYIGITLNRKPPAKSSHFDRWLSSWEMLARLFPRWINYVKPSIDWIWNQQNDNGFWNFGPRPSSISYFPLSENWRKKENKLFDWTTRILILLRKYYDDQNVTIKEYK